jgi:hypothetical protein
MQLLKSVLKCEVYNTEKMCPTVNDSKEPYLNLQYVQTYWSNTSEWRGGVPVMCLSYVTNGNLCGYTARLLCKGQHYEKRDS